MNEHKNRRFTPSGLNSAFDSKHKRFSAYVDASHNIVEKGRTDLAHQNASMIINTNAAKENTPKQASVNAQHGILLIHGLLDSTCIMSSIYDHFDRQDYKVFNLLLPGHGTRPGDLLEVKLEDWLACCRFAIQQLRKEVTQLTVVGFSLGAALAIHLRQLGEAIDSMVLFAPAIQIKNKLNKLTPLIHRFKDASDKLAWVNKSLDLDYAKYQSLTVNAVYQTSRLTDAIHAKAQQGLHCPFMAIMSHDDETVSSSAAIALLQSFNHPLNHLWLYSNHTNPESAGLSVLPSHYPEQNILHFSHTALTIAPEHPHYGAGGDFRDFEHYRFDRRAYEKNKLKVVMQGAVSFKAMKHYHLQRLHYNPDFYPMMARVDDFIERLKNHCHNDQSPT